MKEEAQKLIENTLKDMLLGNTALTFLFAIPIAFIARGGLNAGVWGLTLFVAPSMLVVIVWIICKLQSHALIFFQSIWLRRLYVVYVLISTELLLVYSIFQVVKALVK